MADGVGPRVHPLVDRAAAYSWRLLAIAAVIVGAVWLTGQLLVVVVPVIVAALLTRALYPVHAIVHRRLPSGFAAALTLVGFLLALAAVLALVGIAVAGELDELGPTLTQALDDVEDWLVNEAPFDITRGDLDRWRDQAGEAVSRFLRGGSLTSGALIAAEIVIGAVLAVIVTFFFLEGGHRIVARAIRTFRARHRDGARRAAGRAWDAAGAYLRGAAILGIVEAIVMGVTLLTVGAGLIAPVMLITFLLAFVPIVGAIVAGIVAVLVALATAGTVQAVIVAVVALVVQQLDNDLLAPFIYGRTLRLHPLVILLGIAAGGALFGLVGTFLAVPVLAVTLSVLDELTA